MDTSQISSNPFDRVHPKMRIVEGTTMFDVHCPLFNYEDVPDGYLGLQLIFSVWFFKIIEKTFYTINRRADTDFLTDTHTL